MINVILSHTRSCIDEPVDSVEDMTLPISHTGFELPLFEGASKSPSSHDLVAGIRTIIDANDVFSICNPLLESGFDHDSIQHISDSNEFVLSPISASHSHSLFSFILVIQGVL